jgi:hypothetical protein
MSPFRFLSLLLCAALLAQEPPPISPPAMAQTLDLGPSIITLPIHIDLAPVFATVEQTAPRVPPGVETWTPLPATPGAVYRFNLYRDPLVFSLRANRILVRTMAHYWLEVGVKAGSFTKGVGSCGLGKEGYRRVLLGTRAELSLTPNWGLQLKALPDDPSPTTPCEVTFLGYDITDKVVAGMKENMLKATGAMEQQVAESAMLRQKAEAVWTQAQQPIPLAEGVWLSLNPERIRLAPWRSQGKVLTILPEIQAHPAITLGPVPPVELRPLPLLENISEALSPGFKIRVDTDLSFEHATAQLKKQIAGRHFDTEKGSFEVLDAAVQGRDGKALLELTLKGRITGKLNLAGRMVYNEALGTLQLQDLDYTLESKSWMTQFGEWLFRSTLRKTLQEKANWFMDKSLQEIRALAQQGLNRPLAPGLTLSGTLNGLKLGQPRVLADRFRLDAFLEGQVQVKVDPQGLLGAAH